ncbi:GTPase domain-containing protein [Cellulomonas palmilytica]|uniref:GTPase domain-containing protein n=1 Tax=Cellulomonas palmilytica TaxID=2608402 RepID=UPI001F3F072E|nr:GTPase domain-containing protein [Cellulomonas palmilytica]UJP38590.1 dynamin family protein [Cellulomonas palmilytica]
MGAVSAKPGTTTAQPAGYAPDDAHPGAPASAPDASASAPDASASAGPAVPDEPARHAGRHTADDPREILARPLAAGSLLDAVRDLRRDVERTTFPLDLPGTDAARASRARLVDQLTEHLVPRLTELSAPAVVVVAGSTGAGKSTLVNSLVGHEVTTAGVLRPTTREPVLVHHPGDADLLEAHPLVGTARAVAHDSVPRGIALLDAPDLDSVLDANREAAHRLLEAADLWLFVTTAARYGDALPWRVLEDAVARGASIAMVLNRVPTASLPAVRGDLLARLREHGLAGSPLFVVPDQGPHEGPLEPRVVAPVQRWLLMLAGPDRARTVIGRTLRGSLAALRLWVDELAEAVQAQADAAAQVGALLDEATRAPLERASAAVAGGDVARGAVGVRWAELTSPRGAIGSAVRGGKVRGSARGRADRESAVGALRAEVTHAATTVLTAAATDADADLRAALAAGPAGAVAVLERWALRSTGPDGASEQAARAWVGQGVRAVRGALADPSLDKAAAKRRDKAVRVLGEEVVATVALAAAGGVDDALGTLTTLVGPAAQDVVAELRADLERRARARVSLVRDDAAAPLADPDLASDAASRLRLRLAVIKGLT